MKLELNKDDLVSMVKGQYVPYDKMDIPKIKWLGRFVGGFVDKWEWDNQRLKDLTEEQLVEVYKILKP